MGYETLSEYGSDIGYQIRFEKKKSAVTKVLFLTEGLLLRQVSTDPSLSMYDVLVLDEVHERHLHADFLLGVVKCLLQQRSDLKIILMSATINIKLFQDYFNGEAPVIQVPGRLYPIQLKYMPVPSIEQSDRLNPAPYVRILQLIDKKYPSTERGDLLVFLSGIKEITIVSNACKEYAEKSNNWIVLALHSTLSLADQDKVFDYAPDGIRKCIISTNIAETSVTIDGVRFVVDSGKVKEMQYDPVCKMQRLKESWISRASAEQRKGRSGRTGPGVCFRLFSENEFKALKPFTTPEIQRVPLDSIILQMVSMGLPDVRKFPFIEPPPAESLEESVMVLKAQNALNDDESLTVTGKMLANLPVDVSIGKMLIMGTLFNQIDSVLSLAAALSVQNPFTNDAYTNQDCVASRRQLDSDHGDPITLLNSFREWLEIKAVNRENSRKWCRKRGLEEQRFYEMSKLRQQFQDLLEDAGLLKKDLRGLSSNERVQRHGELKTLREMKREFHKKEGSKKKKVLKMFDRREEDEDGPSEALDIKDIEFRMRNDTGKVLRNSKTVTYKDLMLLKVIVASGLYPQLAIGDEFNSDKSGVEQLFHTRVKPFNVLHPNGIFATYPEYASLDQMYVVNGIPGFDGRHPVSNKHQLLIYLSLLETNKPYLINTMRMPALQTFLLFAKTLDTNVNMSRLVIDSWVEIRFPKQLDGIRVLCKALKLRQMWQSLLKIKLDDDDGDASVNEDAERTEQCLSQGLVDFIHTEPLYAMRRLLPGDLKMAFVGPGRGQAFDIDENPFHLDGVVELNRTKGGFTLNECLTFNCLDNTCKELDSTNLAEFACDFCEESLYGSAVQISAHYFRCFEKGLTEKEDSRASEEHIKDPNAEKYACDKCNKVFVFSSTEILRHIKSCSQ